MNKATSVTLGLSLSTILAFSMTGCGEDKAKPSESQTTQSSSPTPQINREEPGYAASYKNSMELKDQKDFKENNFIATSPESKFTITSYGTVDKDGSNMAPAEGEVFHTIHYTYTDSESLDARPKAFITVNGTTKAFTSTLFDQGTIVIAAPKDAEVLFGLNLENVSQTINVKTAERKSVGIADVLYVDTKGNIENGTISMPVPAGGVTPTLSYTVLDAQRLPYLEEESLGWAENGKNAWVVLDMSPVSWKLPGFDQLKGKSKATLVDDEGNKYKATFLSEGNTTDNNKLAFNVPADKKSFTVLTETSADFSSWGKSAGKIENAQNDQTKITFETIKK